MRQRGLDTSRDHVYPDLVFAIPAPPYAPGDPETVGVGVMAYYGNNDDRKQADEIHAAYVTNVKTFILWLLDNGRKIRLFCGDAVDVAAVHQILADLRTARPDLDLSRITAVSASSFEELTMAMAPTSTVVATRFHNVMCALKLGKPTISIGYAKKNVALMADMGLPEFYQYAGSLDVEKLKEQFTELEGNAVKLRQVIAERNTENAACSLSSSPRFQCSCSREKGGRPVSRAPSPERRTPGTRREAARRRGRRPSARRRALSSATFRKSRIAVPAQCDVASAARRGQPSGPRTSTVRKSTL